MCVIGLTGSLGTGKTTVANMFADLGAKVLSADKIAHQQLAPKAPCFKPIVKMFGREILTAGRIDRKKIASCVFQDLRKLKKLEQIIHPIVRKKILERIRTIKQDKCNTVIIVDVPLLFEAKFNKFVDKTIVIKSNQSNQLSRAVSKMGLTRAQALRRIKVQMPLRQKIRLADMIIDNNETLTQTKKQVKRIWEKL